MVIGEIVAKGRASEKNEISIFEEYSIEQFYWT